MKRVLIFAVGVCLLAFLAPRHAFAAKADGKKAKLIAKYDKNGNGVIDGEEKDALRKDFAADPKGPLKAYDKDGDGKLSDEEIAAIKPGSGATKSADKAKDKTKKKSTTEGEKAVGTEHPAPAEKKAN